MKKLLGSGPQNFGLSAKSTPATSQLIFHTPSSLLPHLVVQCPNQMSCNPPHQHYAAAAADVTSVYHDVTSWRYVFPDVTSYLFQLLLSDMNDIFLEVTSTSFRCWRHDVTLIRLLWPRHYLVTSCCTMLLVVATLLLILDLLAATPHSVQQTPGTISLVLMLFPAAVAAVSVPALETVQSPAQSREVHPHCKDHAKNWNQHC